MGEQVDGTELNKDIEKVIREYVDHKKKAKLGAHKFAMSLSPIIKAGKYSYIEIQNSPRGLSDARMR